MDIKRFLNLLDCAYTLGIEDSHFGVRPKIPKKFRSKNELFYPFGILILEYYYWFQKVVISLITCNVLNNACK